MSQRAPVGDESMRELIVVDGFNVLHAGVLRGRDRAGWWRPGARAKLLDALSPLAGGPAELRVVFDARGDGEERDIRRSARATNVARGTAPSEDDIRRSAGATNAADDDTDIGSPGRDAHRAKRCGPAAGRRPAGVHPSAGTAGGVGDDDGRPAETSNVAGAGAGGDDGRSAGATNVAEGPGGPGSSGAGGIAVLLAPHADDRIVEEVRREAASRTVTVITSDRELARRVREAGGTVIGAGAFVAGLGGGRPR
jgi:predicted RNA-binding protein with PIN domain